jgi:hypothetical protein
MTAKWEKTMEFDVARVDTPIRDEQSAEYWREKAECLEEWICELIRKNQALRMDLDKEQVPHQHREKPALKFSFRGLYQPTVSSTRGVFRRESSKLSLGAGTETCLQNECAESPEWAAQNALTGQPLPTTNN